jgi:uroporphyrinogen decarboxylase
MHTGTEMTSYQRVMAVLEGDKPDFTPVVPILREWCSTQAGIEFIDLFESVEKHVYSQTFCVSQFGYDVVYALIGTHAESEAMGSVLKIERGYPPSVEIPVVQDYKSDLPRLKLFDPYKNQRLSTILEGARRLKKRFNGEVPVIVNVRAPFTHANLMRGPENVAKDTYKERENLHKLLEIALYGVIIYAVAAISAGADIILVGDAMGSGDMMSKKQYEEFSFNYTRKLIDMISRSGVKTILHTCGNTLDRLDLMAETGADCLSLDNAVDMEKARHSVGPNLCLMGNLSTTLLAMGRPEEVEEATKETISKAGRDGHLFISGGCLIQQCEPENMRAMIKTSMNYQI